MFTSTTKLNSFCFKIKHNKFPDIKKGEEEEEKANEELRSDNHLV